MNIKKLLTGLLSLTGLAAPQMSNAAQSESAPIVREAIATRSVASAPIVKKKESFGVAQSSPVPRRTLNQKQYRKLCRNNPSLYKSKKHRSKN